MAKGALPNLQHRICMNGVFSHARPAVIAPVGRSRPERVTCSKLGS
jgi:hypothetical protein